MTIRHPLPLDTGLRTRQPLFCPLLLPLSCGYQKTKWDSGNIKKKNSFERSCYADSHSTQLSQYPYVYGGHQDNLTSCVLVKANAHCHCMVKGPEVWTLDVFMNIISSCISIQCILMKRTLEQWNRTAGRNTSFPEFSRQAETGLPSLLTPSLYKT